MHLLAVFLPVHFPFLSTQIILEMESIKVFNVKLIH